LKEFKDICLHFYPRLKVYSRNFIGLDSQDQEDCVQEIFIKIYNNWDKYDPKYAKSTWIYRIARNTFIDYQRSLKAKKNQKSEVDLNDLSLVDQSHHQSEIRFDVNNAISQLESEDQELLYLYYSEDFSLGEISVLQGKSVASLKSKLFRIRKNLKPHLEESYA
jgi:RNA polymerase sigma-70 factor (ECF subfamily)